MQINKKIGTWAEFYQVLEYDLSAYTLEKLDKNKDNKKRYFLAWKIAQGLGVLQKNSIVHSDIKPENILIDSNGHPRIADFDTI